MRGGAGGVLLNPFNFGEMKHLGLFEGIGGFSLAARWAGWETVAWCEWNEFCQKVLNYHFPKAIGHGDITTTDFTGYSGRIDVLTGGFPCQPYSLAGKRLGKKDNRHLWPEMLRAIREIKPKWVVGENVYGLVNWNGGLVFEEVQADLEAEGYEVQAVILPACSVGAPHRRDRVWFIAHSMQVQREREIRGLESKFVASCEFAIAYTKCEGLERRNRSRKSIRPKSGSEKVVADSNSNQRCQGRMYEIRRIQTERHFSPCSAWAMGNWQNFPTQPPLCSRNDGLSTRLAGITFSRHRRESIQAYGNAIVPQVAYQIFQTINQC